jgi:hypothetical protein
MIDNNGQSTQASGGDVKGDLEQAVAQSSKHSPEEDKTLLANNPFPLHFAQIGWECCPLHTKLLQA